VVEHLANIDGELASQVAEGIGVNAPAGASPNHGKSSPALSQANQPHTAATRKVAVLIADGVDTASLDPVLAGLREQGITCELLAPRDATLRTAGGGEVKTDRAIMTMASVLYDAVLVAGGEDSASTLLGNGEAIHYVAEAYRHAKPVGAIAGGVKVLEHAPIPDGIVPGETNGVYDTAGIVTLADGNGDLAGFIEAFSEAIAAHRHHDRDLAAVPA
jgi:catalase